MYTLNFHDTEHTNKLKLKTEGLDNNETMQLFGSL